MTAAILRTNWWALVLRGVLGILLALAAFALPGVTIAVLVTVWGVYALVDGVFAIVSAVRAAKGKHRWGAFLFEGLLGILAGLIAIFNPLLTAGLFVYMIAVWALLTGVLEIVAAIRLRREIQGEWLLILTGALSILFGFAIMMNPVAGAVVLVWWIAAYGLVFGILLIVLGFRLKSWAGPPLRASGDDSVTHNTV